MFTGIIAATGTVSRIQNIGGDWRLTIGSETLDLAGVQPGDSIAVSGVCLTALALTPQQFSADVSRETLACTTLQHWHEGDLVNLELALQAHSRLGGHIVSGHVDGVGEVVSRSTDARSERLVVRVKPALARYIAHKGSVCLDGVSLTVNEVSGNEFGVNIIPHTADKTTLQLLKPGRAVNVEVDVIARYLERLLQGAADKTQGLTLEQLARAGFLPS
ncbi:MAG: riboflavin synthase [Gammaproteobacteria bacterium]